MPQLGLRERRAVELACQDDFLAARLSEVNRSPEAESVTMAVHLIQADEFDVPGLLGDSNRVQEVAESKAGPLAGAGRFRGLCRQ